MRSNPVALCKARWRAHSSDVQLDMSRRTDTALTEAMKSRVVACYDSALVAGSRHAEYLKFLGFAPGRVFVGYDVVDNAHFRHRGNLTSRSAIAPTVSCKHFLTVSRFLDRKNLKVLIAAFDKYAADEGEGGWSLRIIGDGPERETLEEARRLSRFGDRITFHGFIQYDDLPACYAAASCLIVPSRSDQWGLVVNEAMAAGLAVLRVKPLRLRTGSGSGRSERVHF